MARKRKEATRDTGDIDKLMIFFGSFAFIGLLGLMAFLSRSGSGNGTPTVMLLNDRTVTVREVEDVRRLITRRPSDSA